MGVNHLARVLRQLLQPLPVDFPDLFLPIIFIEIRSGFVGGNHQQFSLTDKIDPCAVAEFDEIGALIHHLAISNNVPLEMVAQMLASLGRHLVIEFVPKTDPMVVEMLQLREDVFYDYSEEVFIRAVKTNAHIVKSQKVTDSNKLLIWYSRSRDGGP